jgi:PD-(D/E)XK endonuclease
MQLTTDQKGAIAETAIVHAAVKLGVGVAKPVVDERYDLIFDLGERLWRVQCKWARRYGGIVVVRCYSARRGPDGLLRRRYTAREIDAYAAYCPDLETCYFLPFELFADRTQLHLRIAPARNNQFSGIHFAEKFEFGARLSALGAIAQLGERRRGTPKVAGSSPAGSTSETA